MSQIVEANMSALKRLWAKIVDCAKALDGIDDPVGDYILSLGKRVENLERDVERLETQLQSRSGRGIQH
ncbi:MAG: hypothetical protein WC670_04125 [Pseudolabrys sp.]|jgi:hypothetical protein